MDKKKSAFVLGNNNKITSPPVSTRRELRIMKVPLIYTFAFGLCYFLAILFPQKINILTKETDVKECERMQRKDNDWSD